MDCDDNSTDDWHEAGQRAVMLMTSSIHHPHASGEWITEVRELMTGLTACEMALTLAWVTRLGSEAMVARHDGERVAALEVLRTLGLELGEALSSVSAPGDVRD